MTNSKIEYRALDENIGGAGGFNFGVAAALTFLSDEIWLMDDDGWPELNCLAELLVFKVKLGAQWLLMTKIPAQTSFSYICDSMSTKDVKLLVKYETITPVHPFNGVLLAVSLIKKIGLPDPKYFIWGDESWIIAVVG